MKNDIERETAIKFSKDMIEIGFDLDFSIDSLSLIDEILDSNQVCFSDDSKTGWSNQAGLEAYVGETLVRCYSGRWAGEFNAVNPGPNFYCSHISIGDYDHYPSHFLGYRISNGKSYEGTYSEYLKKIIPFCERRSK